MNQNNLFLITGASSGIGKEISRKLCSEKFEVILTSRSVDKLESIRDEFLYSLFEKCASLGFVECVINNAGVGSFSSIDKTSIEDWDNQINTNLRSSFLITRLFVNTMKKKQLGKFIFINSVAGKYAHSYSNSTAYVASKYGLKGFADTLRTELRKDNIKVISIYPGAINTNFWDSIDVDINKDEMLSPSDLAETIFHTIVSPNSSVVEDVVVRRTAGDF